VSDPDAGVSWNTGLAFGHDMRLILRGYAVQSGISPNNAARQAASVAQPKEQPAVILKA